MLQKVAFLGVNKLLPARMFLATVSQTGFATVENILAPLTDDVS
jgi:hypothetical protein